MSQICIDASFALKLVLNEADSPKAVERWMRWIDAGIDVVAPFHLVFEVVSVIRNKVYRGVISPEGGELALGAFLAQDIQLLHPTELVQRAWSYAVQFNRPTVYDTFYLALGGLLDCEVWTADHRLYNAAGAALPWLRLLT